MVYLDPNCLITFKLFYMSSLEIRVCGSYRIDDKLYDGKCCSVYTGKNVHSETDCAIKCEPKSVNPSFVMNEGKILQILQGGVGIPHLLWFGENGDFRFLITELKGNNLEDYLDICGGKFSRKTTLMIADRIISSIEFIHYKNLVHRDIKPSNFVMGLGKKLHQIYTIDFAFSTMYIDSKTKNMRPNIKDQQGFVGSLKFASLNTLKGHTYSRRDDLQSLGLMLIYFLRGSLPWSNVNGETVKDIKNNILKIREQLSIQKLCQFLPTSIQTYMQYCSSLKYDDIPDYTYLKRILKEKFIEQGYQFDYIYDWILIPIRSQDRDLSNRIPLNRSTKKQDESLLMCNHYNFDFKDDFNILTSKAQEKQAVNENKQGPQVTPRIKRSVTTAEHKKTQEHPINQTQKGKNKKGTKDDCSIF